MRMVDIITKKRDGNKLTKEEIDYFVKGFSNGNIPDYQVSSLLMAIYFVGMDMDETINLTKSMIETGTILNLDEIKGYKVDKHSTGGVGDKTTLVVGPLVSSLGVVFPKMSGRGLGFTGGTIDKLESIPGFNVLLDKKDIFKELNKIGMCVVSQSEDLVKADKLIYSLRDVTGTVPSIPLIASSIMSKKIASGADLISLDVKVGSGAFMKDLDDAIKLSKCMIEIGKGFNKKVHVIISNMDSPLGCAIGNNLEVIEAINTLNGKGPKDFEKLCLEFSKRIIYDAKITNDLDEAYKLCYDNLHNGKAFNKFKEFVKAQGGDIKYIDNPDLFDKAKNIIEIKSNKKGYINKIIANKIGISSMKLGAGREKKEDIIDFTAGIILNKKPEDFVNIGDVLATIHTNKDNINDVINDILDTFIISDKNIKEELIIKFLD